MRVPFSRWGALVAASLAGMLAVGVAAASAAVLDVGDSLTVGSASTLRQVVPGIQIDAQVGRPSSTGVSILASEYRGQSVVVFDLGTNDAPSPGPFLANLEQVRRIIGDACLVIATINRPPVSGVSYAGMNRAIDNFAARDGNTQVVPWADYPQLRPQVVYSDGVHVTPYGYVVRGHLIANAIAACGAATVGPASGQTNLPPPASAGAQAPAPPPTRPKPVTRLDLVRAALAPVAALFERLGDALALVR